MLTGGRCPEVIYEIKVPNGTSKWWSLWTGGRCSLMVIGSGLTVYQLISSAICYKGLLIHIGFLVLWSEVY
jgi:hypothetical protein